jgi:asparagine synthetase B (glutamine-hydrolysing)
MLEHEPSWLVDLGPGSRGDGHSSPSAIELRTEGKGPRTLRIELGSGDAAGPALAQRDGSTVLLDGFLHDRRPLEAALSSGSRRAASDAEFVLSAFLELGEQILPWLRGSFALVAWDGRDGSLLCTRDLTGSHPLFFSLLGERVLVAASHGALLDIGRVPADFDRVAIARWVQTGSSSPRRTFYAAIERLPPGYALGAKPGGFRIWRYWNPAAAAGATGELRGEEAVRRFDELLDRAVERSAARGRLGVLLSGGVDSAVVAASAAAVSRARSLPHPLALSYVYPHPDASEEATQRSVAAALGLPHHIVPLAETVGREGLLAAALRLTERCWTPPINPWEPCVVHLAEQAARRGCRVIVGGEGGNDWFELEWDQAADLLRGLKLVELARWWSHERRAGRPALETAWTLLWRSGGRLLLRDAALGALQGVAGGALAAARRRRLRSWLPSEWFLPDDTLRQALVAEWLARSDASSGWGRAAATARERRLDSVHLVVVLENRFLLARAIGVDFANPAVDPDLVELLCALPRAVLALGDRGKGLVRESVRRRAGDPAAALLGFAWLEAYFGDLLRHEGPRALGELGGLPRLSSLGIVDAQVFARALRGPALGREVGYYQVWQTLACEAWLRSRA